MIRPISRMVPEAEDYPRWEWCFRTWSVFIPTLRGHRSQSRWRLISSSHDFPSQHQLDSPLFPANLSSLLVCSLADDQFCLRNTKQACRSALRVSLDSSLPWYNDTLELESSSFATLQTPNKYLPSLNTDVCFLASRSWHRPNYRRLRSVVITHHVFHITKRMMPLASHLTPKSFSSCFTKTLFSWDNWVWSFCCY